MEALKALLGEVGDLILAVAEALKHLHGVQIHVSLHIVVRQIGAVLVVVERRTGLHFETVAGDVLRLERGHGVQRLHPLLLGLIGQAVHEIHRHIVKSGLAGRGDGLHRLGVGVGAAQSLEKLVLVGLHPEGDPVEARMVQGG